MLHRTRNLLVRQRTMLVSALRAHRAEFGIIAPQDLRYVELLTKQVAHEQERLSELVRSILQLQLIVHQLHETIARVREIETRLAKWHRQSKVSQSIATVPGVGIKGASAIAATVADPSLFLLGSRREILALSNRCPRSWRTIEATCALKKGFTASAVVGDDVTRSPILYSRSSLCHPLA